MVPSRPKPNMKNASANKSHTIDQENIMLLRLVQGAGGGLSWEGEGFSGSPRGFLENICLNTALTECLFRCDLSNCAQKCADLICRDRREA